MNTPFTDNYDFAYLLETMMGPNAMRVAEEMCSFLPLEKGWRVLDLGCGMGISSVLLAQKYGATVFAADLWITPGDNFRRFERLGLAGQIIPLSVDANADLPFAKGYFDLIFSVDSYHYYGNNESMLPKLLPLLKPGGFMAVAVPGFKRDFNNDSLPDELRPFWQPDWNFYSPGWWRKLWEKEAGLQLEVCREMDCCKQAWEEWLKSPNPYAQGDIPMMAAEGGKYFNLVQLVSKKL